MSSAADKWFEALTGAAQAPLLELRELILTTHDELAEEIKWNRPCYSLNHLVCYLQNSANHVTIGFQRGAHLTDPDALLEGVGRDMRHIKIGFDQIITSEAIADLIRLAVEHDIKP